MRLMFFTFWAMCAFVFPSFADMDEGLYDPKAPAGSSFIRFLNWSESDVIPKIDKKSYNALSADSRISPYYVVPHGDVALKIGEEMLSHAVEADQYYTAVLTADIKLFEDTKAGNPLKGVIAFYNLSAAPLSLEALNGEKTVPVFADVVAMESTAREINAAKIGFAVKYKGADPLTLEDQILERAQHYSIFTDGQRTLFVQAKIDTVK